MLPKISREPRELRWQRNLGKNKPKMYKTSCLDRIVRRRNVVNGSEDVYSWVFGVGDFKYATQNFKGAKGVEMATKFGQK